MRKLKGTLIMIGECVRMSLSNIRGSKVRSFLTVLGIMIGVTAVIALITTVNGVTGSISDSFLSMGAGTLTVSVSGSDLKTGMTREDLAELASLEPVEKGSEPAETAAAPAEKAEAAGETDDEAETQNETGNPGDGENASGRKGGGRRGRPGEDGERPSETPDGEPPAEGGESPANETAGQGQ